MIRQHRRGPHFKHAAMIKFNLLTICFGKKEMVGRINAEHDGMSTFETVREMMVDQFKLEPEQITPDATLESSQDDSAQFRNWGIPLPVA